MVMWLPQRPGRLSGNLVSSDSFYPQIATETTATSDTTHRLRRAFKRDVTDEAPSATHVPTSVSNTSGTTITPSRTTNYETKHSTNRTEKVTNNTIKICCISTSPMIRLAGMETAAPAACCTRATNHPRDKSTRTMCSLVSHTHSTTPFINPGIKTHD